MACITQKIGYATKKLAETALSFAQVNGEKGRKKPVRVFLCEYCGRYHLTSQEKR